MKIGASYGNLFKTFIGPFILLVIGVVMAALSWLKWPDILIDFGRELYVPWQLEKGCVLYKDIAIHFYGPFSPYLNSLLFKAFGARLMTLAIFNIVLIAALTYLIYRIFLEATDSLVATATGATFLSAFAFSQYVGVGNYNYVTPYSYALTHGLSLSLFSIYLFWAYLKRRNNLLLGIIGIFVGLVYLTKLEVFLAILSAVAIGLLLVIFTDRLSPTQGFKRVGALCLGFALPIIVFVGYLSRHMPVQDALSAIAMQIKQLFTASVNSNLFYRRVSGLDAPLLNLTKLFITAGWYLLILLILGILSYVIKVIPDKYRRIGITLAFGFATASTLFLVIRIPWVHWMEMSRALPLAMLVLGVYQFIALWRLRKSRREFISLFPVFLFTIFGFVLLFKMILNVHVYHYGFALAMPATLLAVMALLYYVPYFIGKMFGNVAFIRALSVMLICIALAFHINLSRQIYKLKTFALGSGGDKILTWGEQISAVGQGFKLALEKIEEFIGPNENFVVIPEGIMLNYLSRRRNPSAYTSFLHGDLIMFKEEQIVDALNRCSPDYVILVDRDVSEWGYRYFGLDYAVKISSWVKSNYAPIYIIGNQPFSGQGFGIIIAKRITNP